MNATGILNTMSPTMLKALAELERGEPIHGREYQSLLSRGLIDADLQLTALGYKTLAMGGALE